MTKEEMQAKIVELEAEMVTTDFWSDKNHAQAVIKEIAELKAKIAGVGKYDKGNAVMTIFSGAGGDDAEDFSAMLLNMYIKFFEKQKFEVKFLHENKNDHGGYRNITLEIHGKNVYGMLKNESGVHRLVRISPFNAKQLRHTSFSMVEVIPDFKDSGSDEIVVPADDIRVEFSRSSGPGGQNVNKRETAVRVVHIPTGIAVHVETERSQEQNREKAIQVLKGKLFKKQDDERKATESGMYISKTTEIEWGNQIRSYVLHPYKMVKDHRTNVETSNVDAVLEDGEIMPFIEAEREL
ncbi:MAG: Peptide chain release factor 2 [Parcubacteria group bacterium GW2011_GWA1_44_13]|uniref:Peptide chain release factor 2 n=1 Tax=Candidatus Nomurabacteria bacterium GW2011_GWB1_44_12 TaxID=1618748 RepID=A0A837I6V7_9BACT|nr:MAG: Peptide chain release factor 2 [Candidatus Nomurabacteria bacterium GW2011_GWD1_44_10]KKT36800.1 MAG: Peptide chain release factor 2 [Candidatus Nomurabacteria bacterium GW2011_GWB1_44_12]KKT37426.1 MAG: Peptide chain release factor 2 [Parcubacteria group bacterium GW2011_GWA1_44_13]HBB43844.1 peptide chain release factor 2 [Candidatus Yonathbacteria bacterium]